MPEHLAAHRRANFRHTIKPPTDMRPPFKTEDQLRDRYAVLTELERLDYRRRLEQSSVAALAAYLERDLAQQTLVEQSATHAQMRKLNLSATLVLLTIGATTILVDLPHGRTAAWFVAGAWIAYLAVAHFWQLPYLRLKYAEHWGLYQQHSRQWAVLMGNQGFAEHLSLTEKEYKGEAVEESEQLMLAMKGFALLGAGNASRP